MADEATANTAPTEAPAQESPTSAEPAPQPADDDDKGVEYWKKRARENEARAKANAEAAKEWERYQKEHKTEAQKQADAKAALEADRDAARSEARRARAALAHGLTEEQVALLDPSGDDEQFEARAAALADMLSASNQPQRYRDPNLGREQINPNAGGDWLRQRITGA